MAETKEELGQFYRSLFQRIDEGIFILRDRKFVWCNRRAEKITGYTRAELVNHSGAGLFRSREAYREFARGVYETLGRQSCYDIKIPLKRKNGELFHAGLSFCTMHRTNGRIREIIAVGQDLSARKMAEQDRRERTRRLEILNKVTAKIGSSIQLKEVLHYIAKSILKLTGLDSCSIVLYDETTDSLQDYVSIGLDEKFQKSLKWRLRPGGVTEWVVKHKEPLIIPETTRDARSLNSRATKQAGVRATVVLPILSKGKVIGVIFVNSFRPGEMSLDVVSIISSIASQAARALENAKLYRQVSEKVPELSALHLVGKALVSTLDVPELLKEVVTVLHKSFGYKNCAILLLDIGKMELTIGASYGVPSRTVQNLRIKADEMGITGWVARTGQPLYVPDIRKDSRYVGGIKGVKSELAVPLKRGKQVIGVLDVESMEVQGFGDRDLRVLSTVAAQMAMAIENAKLFEEAKRAYQDLKVAQADVVQAGKMAAVGQLAAGIAHELNNPIGGILGYAQFTLSKIEDLNGQGIGAEEVSNLKRYLGYIERESERCKNIVQNLLNFSRTSPLGYVRTDVNGVLVESLQFLEHNLLLNNIKVSKRLSRELPRIFGDGNQLQQVFINIILNAQKAMRLGGSLKVTTRQAKNPDKSKAFVEVAVSDTGCGIPEADLPHIFEPFFTTRKVGEGTGLGLSVSYKIVKNHGGDILVDSKVNRGTTFIVRLPVNHKPSGAKTKIISEAEHE
jgi:PAS domain S-box-containing protein